MHKTQKEEAIPLVTIESGKFVVNNDAIAILREIPGPLVVLGVAGMYRTGKSYLLNRVILNRENGFGVAPTITACTKGIWIWSKPLKGQTDTGEIVNIIVLDSEGLGALDQDSSHDCRIFALVLLLSSVFLYNSTGAIDENAISNLSLVVNLTKHIRVKSKGGQKQEDEEEDDSEEFARYFPSFLWVLRDFSLQLKDEEGEEISPKQYLENSLKQHKGISDEVEQKNRVRRLIQSFFKERECFPMVRPLTDEENLHKLEQMDIEQLRPEFTAQVLELRKKMMSLNKKKTIKGKEVSGELLGGLLISYVQAINEGAVPNIESAWNYICQNQCKQLVERCFNEFQYGVKEQLENNFPVGQDYLESVIHNLKKDSISKFNKQAIIEQKEEFQKQLIEKIKELVKNLRFDNDREFESVLFNALNLKYSEKISPRLLSGVIESPKDFEELIWEFKNVFDGLEPDGPKKKERILSFLLPKTLEGGSTLVRQMIEKFEEQQLIKERNSVLQQKELVVKLKSIEENLKQKDEKIKELDCKLFESELGRKKAEESLRNKIFEFEEREKQIKEQIENEKQTQLKISEERTKALSEANNKWKQIENQFNNYKAEQDTKFALIEQRIVFYEGQEKEWSERTHKNNLRLKKMEEEVQERIAKISENYEKEIKTLQNELKKLSDRKLDLEDNLTKRNEIQESMCKDFGDKEEELKTFLVASEKNINDLQTRVRNLKIEVERKEEEAKRNLVKAEDLETLTKTQGQRIKEREDQIQILQIAVEKEKAIQKQNLEFYEINLTGMRDEIEELKRSRESTLSALKITSVNKSDISKQISEIKTGYETKIKKLEEEFEREKLSFETDNTQQFNELRSELKNLKDQRDCSEKEKKKLSEESDLLRKTSKQLEDKVKQLENCKSIIAEEQKQIYLSRIEGLDTENERLRSDFNYESEAIKARTEEQLRSLQSFFDSEKRVLEKKLIEEKQKLETSYNEQLAETERRFDSELRSQDEEINFMQNELQNNEIRSKAIQQKLDNENLQLKAKLDNTEKKLAESRQIIEKESETNKGFIDSKLNEYETEKREWIGKIELMKNDLASKSLEVYQLREKCEQFAITSARTAGEREKAVSELLMENTDLKRASELHFKEKQSISEELMNCKIQLGKELALSNQRNEFMAKKIEEQAGIIEGLQKESDTTLKKIKTDLENENSLLKKTLKEEGSQWEKRYEEKKRALKDLEANISQKINESEKIKFVLSEKLNFSESKREELEKKVLIENENQTLELKKFKDQLTIEKKGFASDFEAIRREKYELEITVAETQARHDKDKAVSDGKIQFLEQQNKRLKADLSEYQNNFDQMFQKFHQYRVADKEEIETSHNGFVVSLEQRYLAQITDLKEQQRTLVESHKEKLKVYDQELRKLETSNQELMNQKFGDGVNQEKKINDLLENEKKLLEEISNLKSEREKVNLKNQYELEKEKEVIKRKLMEAEARLKKAEAERNHILFEQEKQKAKWHIEKDQLLGQKNDTLEIIDRLQKQKESATRENEKLRADLKNLKKANIGNTLFSISKNKSELYSFDRSQRKQL